MKIKMPFKISRPGLLLAGINLVLIILVAISIFFGGEPDWPMLWLLFLIIDFPLGLLYIPISFLFHGSSGGPLTDAANFWVPMISFFVLGTIQWYLVGFIVEWLLKRSSRRAAGKKKSTTLA